MVRLYVYKVMQDFHHQPYDHPGCGIQLFEDALQAAGF